MAQEVPEQAKKQELPEHVKQAAKKAVHVDKTANDVLLDIYNAHEKYPHASMALTQPQMDLLGKTFQGHNNHTYQTKLHFQNGKAVDAIVYYKPNGDRTEAALQTIDFIDEGGYGFKDRGTGKGLGIKGNVHVVVEGESRSGGAGDVFITVPTIQLDLSEPSPAKGASKEPLRR